MVGNLSKDDEQFIHDLLQWDSKRRSIDWILCNFALILAGAIIVTASLATLFNLNDRMIFSILVPGIVIGLFFVGLYVLVGRRIKERHRIALIMKKFMSTI